MGLSRKTRLYAALVVFAVLLLTAVSAKVSEQDVEDDEDDEDPFLAERRAGGYPDAKRASSDEEKTFLQKNGVMIVYMVSLMGWRSEMPIQNIICTGKNNLLQT